MMIDGYDPFTTTKARVMVHVRRRKDMEEILRPLLKRYPGATVTEMRPNVREPLEGGYHIIIYLKKSDLEGGGA